MIRNDKLIAELQKLPVDVWLYPYEGEITGLVVVNSEKEELGYIPFSQTFENRKEEIGVFVSRK